VYLHRHWGIRPAGAGRRRLANARLTSGAPLGIRPGTRLSARLSARPVARDFGTTDALREQFTEALTTLFGSGWVWLALDSRGMPLAMDVAND